MPTRNQLLSLFLWYLIFAWGIWLGGTLYQMLVVVPMWSEAPPESLRNFLSGTSYNRTIYNFFGPPFIAARAIPTVIALALAWHRPKHRVLLAIAVVCLTAVVIFTLFYIYPINSVLFDQAGGNRTPSEITILVRIWIWSDRIRLCVGAFAFVAILKAFRLPLQDD